MSNHIWSISSCKHLLILLGLFVGQAFAQQHQDSEGTRQLYYLASAPKESLPPISAPSTGSQAPPSGAMHLGLRYNLVLMSGGGTAVPVASDRVLRTGDCFSIELQSNRSGYLYVLAKQSSNSWLPLLPSAQMPDEGNVIDPGKKIRIPKSYCFEVRNPPGTETLFVVLSRDPRDFYELYEAIKRKSGAAAPALPNRPASSKEPTSGGALSAAVEHLNEKFATRDIALRKVSEPQGTGGKEGSVYVVSTSDKPVTSMATEIHVRHR